MFNGIIYNRGIVQKIIKSTNGSYLYLKSNLRLTKKNLGISISCDGVCLTLIFIKKKIIKFFLSNETLKKSKFSNVKKGDIINLELPLKLGQEISGHICQGHVDTVATVNKIYIKNKSIIYDFKINKVYKKDLVKKASILINGVSFTISKITAKGFQIWAIPHTLKLTNLSKLRKGDLTNVEIDILSKYVKKYINEK